MNISLQSAENLIGDVPQAVERSNISPPSAGGNSPSELTTLLRYAMSERKTSKFLDWVATNNPDIQYEEFIKSAAKAGVIDNPRIQSYGEILKDKYRFATATKYADEERKREKQYKEEDYNIKTSQESGRNTKSNMVRENLNLTLYDPSQTIKENIYERYNKDPHFVDKALLQAEKTLFGKDDGLLPEERSSILKEYLEPLNKAYDQWQEDKRQSDLEEKNKRISKAAELKSQGVNQVITPKEVTSRYTSALEAYTNAMTKWQSADNALDKNGNKIYSESDIQRFKELAFEKQKELKEAELSKEKFLGAKNQTKANLNTASEAARLETDTALRREMYNYIKQFIGKKYNKEIEKEMKGYGLNINDFFDKDAKGILLLTPNWSKYIKSGDITRTINPSFMDEQGNREVGGGILFGNNANKKSLDQIIAELK